MKIHSFGLLGHDQRRREAESPGGSSCPRQRSEVRGITLNHLNVCSSGAGSRIGPQPDPPGFSSSFCLVPAPSILYMATSKGSFRGDDTAPPPLSPRFSVLGLIDGCGPAVKPVCCYQIRADKHGLHLLTNQECLGIRNPPSSVCCFGNIRRLLLPGSFL